MSYVDILINAMMGCLKWEFNFHLGHPFISPIFYFPYLFFKQLLTHPFNAAFISNYFCLPSIAHNKTAEAIANLLSKIFSLSKEKSRSIF